MRFVEVNLLGEVLFNREYRAIWERRPDGKTRPTAERRLINI
jgi:hypothetical protein